MPPARSTQTAQGPIKLQRLGRAMIKVPVEGLTPLIVNKFSAKAQQIMLDKQMGKAQQRAPKDPEENYRNAMHLLEDGTAGFPAVGFKAAIVDAARFFKGSKLPMTDLRRMIFVNGVRGSDTANRTLLVPVCGEWTGDVGTLKSAEPVMRQDYVRNESGVADIRFRPEYDPWSAVLEVIYVENALTLEAVLALIDAAGLVGLGEWRPGSKESNTGSYGTFRVPDGAEAEKVVVK
jgi:hypothetical protein